MERALDVLELLSSSTFLSGESLAKTLGVTRAAVWRHVAFLKKAGVEIRAISGKGYKLCDDYEPLNPNLINEGLLKRGCEGYDTVDVVKVIDSTNAVLSRGYAEKRLVALFAEYQLAGKGRREDRWICPPGAGVCFSLSRWFDQPQASFSSLGLVVGIAVVNALKTLGIEGLKLKWPNDVVFRDAKLAGILIELRTEVSGPSFVVIGIGLNTCLGARVRDTIDKKVIDLKEVSGKIFSRNVVASVLLSGLERDLKVFGQRGFEPFISDWTNLDYLLGRTIRIDSGSKSVVGKVEGVDKIGALLLRCNGVVKQFLSGHITEL